MQIMQKVIQLCHMFKLFSVCFIRNVHILRNKTGEKNSYLFSMGIHSVCFLYYLNK